MVQYGNRLHGINGSRHPPASTPIATFSDVTETLYENCKNSTAWCTHELISKTFKRIFALPNASCPHRKPFTQGFAWSQELSEETVYDIFNFYNVQFELALLIFEENTSRKRWL